MHDHLHSLPIDKRYSDDTWRAIHYAAEAHKGQMRKMNGDHYIEHPFGVLEIVRTITDDERVHMAAVLHDTVEDTEVSINDLRRDFDDEVADIVWGVTKDDTIPDWRERNEAYLERLLHDAPDGSVIVALADKIHDITDMIESYAREGDAMWQHFSAKPDDQLWWYTSVLEVARARLPDCALNGQLEALIEKFRQQVVGGYARRACALGV